MGEGQEMGTTGVAYVPPWFHTRRSRRERDKYKLKLSLEEAADLFEFSFSS